MAQDREAVFREAERCIGPSGRIALVGHKSRTWYEDQSLVFDILLWVVHRGVPVAALGDTAWHHCVQTAAQHAGVRGIDMLLSASRSALEFLEQTTLGVVFPTRVGKHLGDTAPEVAALLDRGVPLFLVMPDGNVSMVRPAI